MSRRADGREDARAGGSGDRGVHEEVSAGWKGKKGRPESEQWDRLRGEVVIPLGLKERRRGAEDVDEERMSTLSGLSLLLLPSSLSLLLQTQDVAPSGWISMAEGARLDDRGKANRAKEDELTNGTKAEDGEETDDWQTNKGEGSEGER